MSQNPNYPRWPLTSGPPEHTRRELATVDRILILVEDVLVRAHRHLVLLRLRVPSSALLRQP